MLAAEPPPTRQPTVSAVPRPRHPQSVLPAGVRPRGGRQSGAATGRASRCCMRPTTCWWSLPVDGAVTDALVGRLLASITEPAPDADSRPPPPPQTPGRRRHRRRRLPAAAATRRQICHPRQPCLGPTFPGLNGASGAKAFILLPPRPLRGALRPCEPACPDSALKVRPVAAGQTFSANETAQITARSVGKPGVDAREAKRGRPGKPSGDSQGAQAEMPGEGLSAAKGSAIIDETQRCVCACHFDEHAE
jgi:hypothetical protein